MTCKLKFALALCLGAVSTALAGDWPQFLGPARNGVYDGTDISPTWPKDGPAMLWQKSVGEGFSGPVAGAGRVILFHRSDDKEIVESFDAKTGESKWTSGYPTAYRDDFGFDEGPRATPTIEGGRIYTFGAEGVLQCLDFTKGKTLWQVNTKKDFRAQKGFFGAACSPLVEGNAVLLNIGGRDGAGIVAFEKSSGKVLWKTCEDEASYSSPVAATIDGRRYAFFFTRAGLVALNPVDGAVQFQFPWRARANESVNAAAPVVVGDTVFVSACYGTGAALLRVRDHAADTVWSGDESLSCHYATSVQRDGFLYGIDGRADPGFSPSPSLRCIELKSGKVRWRDDSVGAATAMLAAGDLLILTEQGELVRAPATPDGFKPLARAQVFPNGMRAYPALANGFFYARSKNRLFCLDLSSKNGP
jgi:outer membrane protein assembly factor BamB